MSRSQESDSCYSRRQALQSLGGGLASLAVAQLLGSDAALAAGGTHFAPRAKRIIHLFMNGGPFQGDLFDPKPALNQYAGQRPEAVRLRTENATGGLMAVPFKFEKRGQSGLEVSDLLPKTAGCADDL